ncbi:Fe superoxide dismutase [Neofusicoccum parvum]|nr:Fe superoxide dismutase [Neofusicoccum parvum]
MILARLLRPQQPLRAAQRCTQRLQHATPRRSIHEVPPITNHGSKFAEFGVPELLSAKGYKTAWTDYQQLIVDRLNEKVAGTTLEDDETRSVVVQTAREPQFAATFNYASMAFNNHFFFEAIADKEEQIPAELAESLTKSFWSLDTFRTDFLATADAMFGPGFVWLVWHSQPGKDNNGSWKILSTYLAGSPLSDAHWRQQPVDMNTQSATSAGGLSGADYARQSRIQNTAGAIGRHSAQAAAARNRAPGGADITPVLCVNTWEHVWVPDWGVAGKRGFLETWWSRISWRTVLARTPPDAKLQTRI